jgi:hypothetical protein
MEVMKAVYGRRNKVPQPADEEMLRYAREAAREVEG